MAPIISPPPQIHTLLAREDQCPSLPGNITLSEVLYLRNLQHHYNMIGALTILTLFLFWFIVGSLFFLVRWYWRKKYPEKYIQYELDCLETHMEAVYRLGFGDGSGSGRVVRQWVMESDAEEQMRGMARRARRRVREEGRGGERVRLRDVVGSAWGGWRERERTGGRRNWYGRRIDGVRN
ncbi:hypothetical protein VTL71DRAFT_12368 [Oculimacula yallundae]|uniref:Uncharacterized protein n=1 Tax=Oculimacula yallundae TaxID=86028 RepID=A0ABR4CMD6_9HELO